MANKMPLAATDLECPILTETRQVEFSVNVFRDTEHKGLEVETCSEFVGRHGAVTCTQTCIHSPEARRLHDKEVQKHREELAQIGPNVIG